MRALEIITGHVISNPAYTYKFQLKTTIDACIRFLRLLGRLYKNLNFYLWQSLYSAVLGAMRILVAPAKKDASCGDSGSYDNYRGIDDNGADGGVASDCLIEKESG